MHHLGLTRSSLKHNHLLHTPDTFVRTPLPGAEGVEFIVHAAPRLGARFTQMTAEFAAGGTLGPAPAQRFLYVLDGKIELKAGGKRHVLKPGGYLMEEDGKLNVAEALALSGGTLLQANTGGLRVIRRNADGTVLEFPLSYNAIMKGTQAPLVLQARDIVYVPISGMKVALANSLLGEAAYAAIITH